MTFLLTSLSNSVTVEMIDIYQDAIPELLVISRVMTRAILRHVGMILEIAVMFAPYSVIYLC